MSWIICGHCRDRWVEMTRNFMYKMWSRSQVARRVGRVSSYWIAKYRPGPLSKVERIFDDGQLCRSKQNDGWIEKQKERERERDPEHLDDPQGLYGYLPRWPQEGYRAYSFLYDPRQNSRFFCRRANAIKLVKKKRVVFLSRSPFLLQYVESLNLGKSGCCIEW